jgi:hypothetical protein
VTREGFERSTPWPSGRHSRSRAVRADSGNRCACHFRCGPGARLVDQEVARPRYHSRLCQCAPPRAPALRAERVCCAVSSLQRVHHHSLTAGPNRDLTGARAPRPTPASGAASHLGKFPRNPTTITPPWVEIRPMRTSIADSDRRWQTSSGVRGAGHRRKRTSAGFDS